MSMIAEYDVMEKAVGEKTLTGELVHFLGNRMEVPAGETIVLRHAQMYSLSGRTTDAFCNAAWGDAQLLKNAEASLLHHAIQDAVLEKFSVIERDPYNKFRSFFGYPSVITLTFGHDNDVTGIKLEYTGDRIPAEKFGAAGDCAGIKITSEDTRGVTDIFSLRGIRSAEITGEALPSFMKRVDEIMNSNDMNAVIHRVYDRSGLQPYMALTSF